MYIPPKNISLQGMTRFEPLLVHIVVVALCICRHFT